jgi:ribosomal protein S18 acetylase RimI-like enzyme
MTMPTPEAVRLAHATDARAVADLVRQAYQHYTARIGREPAPMGADYEQAIADGTVWVVEVADGIGGVLVLHDVSDHLLIENVAVRPGLQGRGIGSMLIEFAEQHARAHGLTEIRLFTNEKMTENLAYYPRRGFTEVGRRTEAGFQRVFFSKTLR